MAHCVETRACDVIFVANNNEGNFDWCVFFNPGLSEYDLNLTTFTSGVQPWDGIWATKGGTPGSSKLIIMGMLSCLCLEDMSLQSRFVVFINIRKICGCN